MVVLLVGPQMLGQTFDALGEERDLYLGRAGVRLVGPVLSDQLFLDYTLDCQTAGDYTISATGSA